MKPFATRLLAWHARHGRHDLPWQRDRDPYRIWISEIMLQQTQVATAAPYFERFVRAFPDLGTLAGADEDAVLRAWSGLGYYARARNLLAAARRVRDHHGGVLPTGLDALCALPGIGRSTAGAILALAHGRRHAILDGNCKRVYARHAAVDGTARLWARAEACTPRRRVAAYTQAIMDLGATVCVRGRPRCDACPVSADCAARLADRVADFPAPRARRERPRRAATLLLLHNPAGEFLLERRPSRGVWDGLWCVPWLPDGADPLAAAAAYGRVTGAPRPLAPLRHAFTHFTLDIAPLALCVQPAGDAGTRRTWSDRAGLARYGLPAPVRALLESVA